MCNNSPIIGAVEGVKHLNPRQGITTRCPWVLLSARRRAACETPKSPPGDYNEVLRGRAAVGRPHLGYVKHLNPRQGITTFLLAAPRFLVAQIVCETPKSPPGDYNESAPLAGLAYTLATCETPKSPPGDYNTNCGRSSRALASLRCETPKSPPGDYNPTHTCSPGSARGMASV